MGGDTALILAAWNGHLGVVEYLVTHYGDTIDINTKNKVSIVIYYIFYCVLCVYVM